MLFSITNIVVICYSNNRRQIQELGLQLLNSQVQIPALLQGHNLRKGANAKQVGWPLQVKITFSKSCFCFNSLYFYFQNRINKITDFLTALFKVADTTSNSLSKEFCMIVILNITIPAISIQHQIHLSTYLTGWMFVSAIYFEICQT